MTSKEWPKPLPHDFCGRAMWKCPLCPKGFHTQSEQAMREHIAQHMAQDYAKAAHDRIFEPKPKLYDADGKEVSVPSPADEFVKQAQQFISGEKPVEEKE